MTAAKVRAATRLVFLDAHVGVAKHDLFHCVAVFDVDDGFFSAVAWLALADPARFIYRDLFSTIYRHFFQPGRLVKYAPIGGGVGGCAITPPAPAAAIEGGVQRARSGAAGQREKRAPAPQGQRVAQGAE